VATLPVTAVVAFLVGLDFESLAPLAYVTGALVPVFPSTAAFFYSSAFSALTLLFFSPFSYEFIIFFDGLSSL